MATVSSFELRLLMCTLRGAIREPRVALENDESVRALESVISNVEKGAYADALLSPPLKSVLWQPQDIKWASLSCSPNDFYDSVRSHIQFFIRCSDVNEDLASIRALFVMAAGIATFLAFWQANVTGPSIESTSCRQLIVQDVMRPMNEEAWDSWAIKELMVDGCDMVGLCELPQYLILAKILLVDALDAMKHMTSLQIPKSFSWWACRVVLAHQVILTERSPSLRTAITDLESDMLQVDWEADVHAEHATLLRTASQLESGLAEYVYGHIDHARSHFQAVKEACRLEISLTGVLGFRTVHQVDPKAQMVLIANAQSSSVGQEVKQHQEGSKDDCMGSETRAIEEDILMVPKLVPSGIDECSELKHLSPLQQAVILAQCFDVQKSNPDDELRGWQMAPFIEAVDAQQSSPFMIKNTCQLLRIRWEATRSRTKQRAFLMMEQLVKNVEVTASCEVKDRMLYGFCSRFPAFSVLRKELAEMMVSCGLVGEALRIFEELELWNHVIDCYCLLGKKAAAVDLIKSRLEEQPDDPRLWCALGDVMLDEGHYKKAWEVSKHHYGRAQRSLGRSAYNKGEYDRSVEHWEAALSLNSLHADGWFALGSAALKARKLDKAVDAFTRAVQIEPENGEAWNNIAAIHMTRKKNKEAFVAFREALKFKRSSWQMWENYAHVALDVGNFGQAMEAVDMVLGLSQGKRIDVDCLTRLMDEVESRFKTRASSNGCTPIYNLVENSEPSIAHDEEPEGLHTSSKDNFHEEGSEELHALSQERLPETEEGSGEREWLVTRVGKLLAKVVQHSQSSTTWGLLARWHRVKVDLAMCAEALLKQVRSLQGSDWQHNRDQFEELGKAALQLCTVHVEVSTRMGSKKELYSAQMLLRNLIKQGEGFSETECYAALVARLSDVQRLIKVSD